MDISLFRFSWICQVWRAFEQVSVICGHVSQLACSFFFVLFCVVVVVVFVFYRNLAVTTKGTRGYFKDRSYNRLCFNFWNLCCGAIVVSNERCSDILLYTISPTPDLKH